MNDAAYNRLYANPPKTIKGRVNRAALLIREGCAYTRAYDDCFEMGDGGEVLAHLMERVRKEPHLRDMMVKQGAWSASYENVAPPEPFVLSSEDRLYAFRRATGMYAEAIARWEERACRGLTDDELVEAIAAEIGIEGGCGGPDELSVHYRGAGLKIWASWETVNPVQDKPIFAGKQTLVMARQLYRISDPDERQLALL